MTARIRTLDHVRGLSILAILLVNSIAFAQPFAVYSQPELSPLPLSHDDLTVWWITEAFLKEKFINCLTLLFGVSVYLVGRDHNPADPVYRTPLFRRLSWLVVFGLIHGALIWHGDILLAYALTGFVFWRWQEASAGKLLVWGIGLFVAGTALLLGPNIVTSLSGEHVTAVNGDLVSLAERMRGPFLISRAQHAAVWGESVVSEVLGFMPTTLGLMMIGLGLFKSGLLRGEAKARTYLWLMAAGAISLVLIGWQARMTMVAGFPYPEVFGLYALANDLLCLPVALGYVGVLVLIGRTRIGGVALYPLACAGRMAFTNYLVQSLIMTGLFYGGRGPDWFGEMNHAALVPIVVMIWIGQLVCSAAWMAFFRYGPFEWGWRCLTYQRWMPILK